MSRRTAMNPPTSGPVAAPQLASQLANTLTDALVSGEVALRSLAGVAPRDHRDRAATLLTIYDLHMAPLETVRAAFQRQEVDHLGPGRLIGQPAVRRRQPVLRSDRTDGRDGVPLAGQ